MSFALRGGFVLLAVQLIYTFALQDVGPDIGLPRFRGQASSRKVRWRPPVGAAAIAACRTHVVMRKLCYS